MGLGVGIWAFGHLGIWLAIPACARCKACLMLPHAFRIHNFAAADAGVGGTSSVLPPRLSGKFIHYACLLVTSIIP